MMPYKSEREYKERGNCVSESAQSEDVQVQAGNDEIPDEVASSEALYHTRPTSVSPYTLFPCHGSSLLVCHHDPDGKSIY